MIAAGRACLPSSPTAGIPCQMTNLWWRRLKDLGKGNQQMENLQIEEEFVRRARDGVARPSVP